MTDLEKKLIVSLGVVTVGFIYTTIESLRFAKRVKRNNDAEREKLNEIRNMLEKDRIIVPIEEES